MSAPSSQPAVAPPLAVTVVNGNLKFARYPLLLGHYQCLALTGTERVVDRLIGGTMTASLGLGRYPEAPMTQQLFMNRAANKDNPLQMPRPEAVIVVGLGQEGKLRASDLAHTVRQGVIAWSQHLAESVGGAPTAFELAATLIGSGGTGISPGQSARLIAQGVREANMRLTASGCVAVAHLHLIELYLDRATEAWRSLQIQAIATPDQYDITDTIRCGEGWLHRPLDSSYRGADYDFITAVTQTGVRGDAIVAYTLDTKRARTEVRAQATQGRLLRELIVQASNDQNQDPQIGRTLFQLLVPLEMEPFLGGTTDMLLELDSGTAGIPWELLDTATGTRGSSDLRPWAIRAKLLRKLRTNEFRAQVVDASTESHILVIGEPKCDDPRYPRLPGARAEALAVAERLIAGNAIRAECVRALVSEEEDGDGADARTIVNTLLERDWRIVHIAGHGEPPLRAETGAVSSGTDAAAYNDPRGLVLSSGTFLGSREIGNMRVVPELVFVNCCHLGARDSAELLRNPEVGRYDRAMFAAGVAEALIKVGVRCVIAAGWAVEDGAALAFATRFYDALLTGRRFIDAVADAREAAWHGGGNTWAAYQCYGDPDWTFTRAADAQRSPVPLADEFSGVASAPALMLALETLTMNSRYDRRDPAEQQARIAHLESRFGALWGDSGEVADAFGQARDEAGDRAAAIAWYERAVKANDGTASIKCAEQIGDLRARLAWENALSAQQHEESAPPPTKTRRSTKTARSTAKRAAATGSAATRTHILNRSRTEIESALALLGSLATLSSTVERESICGAAWKRKAMLEVLAGDADAERIAITTMQHHYARALELARATLGSELFYPGLNHLAAQLVLTDSTKDAVGLDEATVTEVRNSLLARTQRDVSFWSIVGLTELRLYESLAKHDLAPQVTSILREYQDLHARVHSVSKWGSVFDQLQFVLPNYARRVDRAEQAAAVTLLHGIEVLAHASASGVSVTGTWKVD